MEIKQLRIINIFGNLLVIFAAALLIPIPFWGGFPFIIIITVLIMLILYIGAWNKDLIILFIISIFYFLSGLILSILIFTGGSVRTQKYGEPLVGSLILIGIIANFLAECLAFKEKLKISKKPSFDKTSRLFGMIKTEKRIELKTASKLLGIPIDQIKAYIYDFVGEGKIEGEFQGKIFIINSGVDEFINRLERSFSEWDMKEKVKYGKID